MIKIYDEEFKELIERTINAASRRLNFNIEDIDVEFGIASPDEIRKINAETRQNDSVTDVLSFQNIEDIALPLELNAYPTEINGEDGSLILGEVLICRERQWSRARNTDIRWKGKWDFWRVTDCCTFWDSTTRMRKGKTR